MVLGHQPSYSRDVQKRPRRCSPQMSDKKRCVASAPSRPSMEDCLPQDVLEAVIGFLDLETLCTARLLSKAFCTAASARVCNLTVTTSTDEAVSLRRFPNVSQVTVEMYREGKGLTHLDQRLLDCTTSIRIQPQDEGFMDDTFGQIETMPRMQKLDVQDTLYENFMLHDCTNLEALILHRCSISVAEEVARMTRLKSLSMGEVFFVHGDSWGSLADVSCWMPASPLTNLQALCIPVLFTTVELPLIGNLTGLTGLTMFDPKAGNRDYYPAGWCSIDPLTRLTRLRALDISWMVSILDISWTDTTYSLVSTALVSLQLKSTWFDAADFVWLFTHQTALTRLSVHVRQLSDLRHIPPTRFELLRCLGLHDVEACDAEGLAVLCRASNLTRLVFETGTKEPQMGLGLSLALERLTQLHSLELRMYGEVIAANEHGDGFAVDEHGDACSDEDDVKILDYQVALAPLKALTTLKIHSRAFDDGDLRALLVLTGLRVLELDTRCVTDDVLPELGVLTNLNTFYLLHNGRVPEYSLGPLCAVLNPLREARGLRPLHTCDGLDDALRDPRGTK